ncbi:hypothetical protein [Nocardia sp. alder85J]|uniref:hypothetical protein n=1 Tax=Nocardia sp. alder85J TaxID=2862949 RepID=UPI001CD60608|nr:hypothetical protein [Nocardia sp. alder85J]MCX4095180.1 hypothetical protein [Nocardia sp. alder85J]
MTDEKPWYVLDLSEGAYVSSGCGAVGPDTFAPTLAVCDGQLRYSLRLWLAPRHPDLLPDPASRRENCLLAVGSADRLALEWRHDGTRHQIGRGPTGISQSIHFDLGHSTTVGAGEIFDARQAAEVLAAYYESGVIRPTEYHLRELDTPDILSDAGATHGLTIDYDEHRPVLPGVTAAEFAAFLDDDDPAVLVLWPLPAGTTVADLAPDELHDRFIQTAGSAGRYTVEIRTATEHHTVGHVVDHPIWGTGPVDIAVGDGAVQVYPNEVFTPAEVGELFRQYVSDGQLPTGAYTTRDLLYE